MENKVFSGVIWTNFFLRIYPFRKCKILQTNSKLMKYAILNYYCVAE